jgi:hypothetical protein
LAFHYFHVTDEHAQKHGTAHLAIDLIVGLLTLPGWAGTIGFMAPVFDIRFSWSTARSIRTCDQR